MTYEEKLSALSHFSMNDVIAISKELLPSAYRACPWKHVGHGVGLLTTEDQLNAYMAAYGEMHQVKCKAAYQNFEFDALRSNFEIVDWGCGQGIGSLTFIDMLREREILHLLKKVTLIEPSMPALKRATIHIQKATSGNVYVLPINQYLPGYGLNDEVEGVQYVYTNVIHLFSNILDIESVNLESLARVLALPNHVHYIMCMGPKNTNSYRINRFCSAFDVSQKAYFSSIDSACYGRTTDTFHNFSCVSRCLKYSGEGLKMSNMQQYVNPTLVCGRPIYDDYDPMLPVQNELVSIDLANLYNYLSQLLHPSDHIFLKPVINGDTLDVLVLRRNTGVMLIKVFEDDILDYDFYKSENGEIDYDRMKKNNIIQTSPTGVVSSYQDNLIKLHIREMHGKVLVNSFYWSVLKKVVYFSRNTTTEARNKFKDAGLKYFVLVGKDMLDDVNYNLLKETGFCYSSQLFDNSIYNSFLRVVSPQWHSYKEGEYLNLTTPQRRLARSEPSPRRKINGVAGSGKTQVLAVRAVNAHLRTGKKVLVLTFNLSLVNYIRYRISQVRADFSWDMIFIINYHQLFIAEANNHALSRSLDSFQDKCFFDHVADKVSKYAAILIDEVQDYQTEWLTILDKYFLEPGGEMVVFGDAKQNIYHRPLDTNGQIRIGFIPGEWNNSLNTGFRFSNAQLTSLAINFQNTFFPSIQTDAIQQPDTLAFNTCIKYFNVGREVKPDVLESNCRWIMQEYHLDVKDVVVLSQTCDVLREIDYCYRMNTHAQTMSTFETKEMYEKLLKKFNITDCTTSSEYKLFRDIKQVRRSKKIHFSADCNILKLSTIHSFKGWESQSVILILLPEQLEEKEQYAVRPEENTEELIYTAITRCKENLFIINCGNKKYHNFFNSFSN